MNTNAPTITNAWWTITDETRYEIYHREQGYGLPTNDGYNSEPKHWDTWNVKEGDEIAIFDRVNRTWDAYKITKNTHSQTSTI
jgi:hypothetical protein